MARPPIAQDWQLHMRMRSDEERRELERQNSENRQHEFDRARIGDLPIRRARCGGVDETSPMNATHHENIYELEINQGPKFSMSHEAPLTPPASEHFDNLADNNISDLRSRVDRQNATIAHLESELRFERTRIQDLRAARHEAVQAQREAILSGNAEIASEKTKISELLILLDQSTEREKQLEREVDEGRRMATELRIQLLDAQRGIQERENRSQLWEQEGANGALRSVETRTLGQESEYPRRRESQLQQRLASDPHDRYICRQPVELDSGASRNPSRPLVPGRSRKQDKQMQRQGYISYPKKTGHRIIRLDRLK